MVILVCSLFEHYLSHDVFSNKRRKPFLLCGLPLSNVSVAMTFTLESVMSGDFFQKGTANACLADNEFISFEGDT